MTYALVNHLVDTGTTTETYYEQQFHWLIESCLNELKTNGVQHRTINIEDAYKYEGSFYSLLLELSVPMHYHWITLRVNGMVNEMEYNSEEHPFILIPSSDLIERLHSYYITKTK